MLLWEIEIFMIEAIAEWEITGSTKNRRKYTFEVYDINSEIPNVRGVFVLSRRVSEDGVAGGTHEALYVGMADRIRDEIDSKFENPHGRNELDGNWNDLIEKGMNAISIYPLNEYTVLRWIHEDVLRSLSPPFNKWKYTLGALS